MVGQIRKGFMEKLTFENLKDALTTHWPTLSETEEQGLPAKSTGGNFTYTEAENRKKHRIC